MAGAGSERRRAAAPAADRPHRPSVHSGQRPRHSQRLPQGNGPGARMAPAGQRRLRADCRRAFADTGSPAFGRGSGLGASDAGSGG